jgi:hypothetical protein
MGRAPLERTAVKSLFVKIILSLALLAVNQSVAGLNTNTATVLLVVGATGEPEYAENFLQQAQLWEKACLQGSAAVSSIGLSTNSEKSDLDLLHLQLAQTPTNDFTPLWVVLIGHGTFDGKEARFNLRGPDLSATQLAEWVKPFCRPLVIINTASASAPFLNKLSGTNRIIITATRSGNEQNFTRFGLCQAQAIVDPKSDLDGDGHTSLLEAFLSASARVAEWYKTEGRLATEHALIDDNGDGLGTPPDWFRGVRAVKKPAQGSADGLRAQQIQLVLNTAELALSPETRAKRDSLEMQVAQLRQKKHTIPEDDYYRQLEALLLELARLQVVAPGGN